MLKRKKNKIKKGFTLIEALVFVFIFSITTMAFYRTITAGMSAMLDAKKRVGAVALANEKMEIIRNLHYDDIATTGGTPSGDLPAEEELVRSGSKYFVNTLIKFVDAPEDGLGENDTNDNTNDYKSIRIEAFWENNNHSKSAKLFSIVAPPGTESVYAGGVLWLRVIDSFGQPVGQVDVHLHNTAVNPQVNKTDHTDTEGVFDNPGSPVADESYLIELTKDGYYPVATMARTSSFEPTNVHGSVSEGAINQKTIVMDQEADFAILTKDPLGNNIPNITFSLEGGRKIGDTITDPPENSAPVYAYDESSLSSGSGARKEFNAMSSGAYFVSAVGPTSDYEFFHMAPSADKENKFSIAPGNDTEETMVVLDKNVDSLLITVKDDSDKTPISGATVNLKSEALSYDVTLTTDAFGKVYFPDGSGPLVNDEEYNLSVDADGYSDYSEAVTINKLISQVVLL